MFLAFGASTPSILPPCVEVDMAPPLRWMTFSINFKYTHHSPAEPISWKWCVHTLVTPQTQVGVEHKNQIQNHAIIVTTNHTCSEIHAEKQIRAGRQTHAVTPIHKTRTHTQDRDTHTKQNGLSSSHTILYHITSTHHSSVLPLQFLQLRRPLGLLFHVAPSRQLAWIFPEDSKSKEESKFLYAIIKICMGGWTTWRSLNSWLKGENRHYKFTIEPYNRTDWN